MANHAKSSSQTDYKSTNLLVYKSTSSLLDPRIMDLIRSSPRENSFNNDKDITIGTDKENKRVAIDAKKLFNNGILPRNYEDRDTRKDFLDINSKIRHLNSELRRVLRAEDDHPNLILSNVWNSFDAVKDEVIAFKLP